MVELVDVVPGSQEWLAARRQGVTATDIVTILGLSAYDSPYSLYWRKLGMVAEAGDSDRFRLGRELEPLILGRWCEKHPLFTTRPGKLWRHSQRAWQMATPDAIVWSHIDGDPAPLELKSWADSDRHAWDDGAPAAVRAQVLWQMDVLDVHAGYAAVLFLPSGEFRSFTIEHDQYTIPDDDDPCDVCKDLVLMREAGWRFMQQRQGHMPAPDADGSAATMAAVKARFGTVDKQVTAHLAPEAWSLYADAAERVDYWTEVRQAAEASLREVTQGAYRLEVDGQVVALRIKFESQVRAHTRSVDMIRRTPRKKGPDDE